MRSMGISPGDAVLVVEHRGEQQIVYNALVAGISMRQELAGSLGEPAIEAVFVADQARERVGPINGIDYRTRPWHPTLKVSGVVHISHRDWIERRTSLGYEELPGHVPGVCRYCKCTEDRACRLADGGACSWIFPEHTVCSAPECQGRFVEDNKRRTAERGKGATP